MTNLNLNSYIKVRTVLDAIQNATHPSFDDIVNNSWESHVLGVIMNVQPEDVVPVVRCRDCRWWHDWNGECYAKEAQGFGHLWKADDYCSYGLRKDGDSNG